MKAEDSGDEEFERIFSRMDELEREEEEAENAIENEDVNNEDDFNFSKLQLSEEVKSSEVMHCYASMSYKSYWQVICLP